MNRSDIPVLAGVAFFIATLAGLLLWAAWMTVRSVIEARGQRQMHNDADPRCCFWWGDRRNKDMRARCHVCRPRRDQ